MSQIFRSRDEQVREYFSPNRDCPKITLDDFEYALDEAEARGAEEQRRKDADGQEPVAWVRLSDINPKDGWPLKFGNWQSVKTKDLTFPLYARPANVAALEARVKVLEVVLNKLLDAISCTGSTEEPDVLIAEDEARAALKREGGV